MKFYNSKTVTMSFENAVSAITESLQKEGFGIITRINMTEKLKEKLNVDFRNYVILGACNPPLAHKALLTEDKIGVMLPCNVIVQQKDAATVEIAAIDPAASMSAVGNPALEGIAAEVSEKLKRAVEAV